MDKQYNATKHERLTYLVECSEAGAVKIGQSVNVKWRVSELQGGCPYPLRVLATTTIAETELHQRFSGCRIRNEWFRLTPEIEEFIRQCA